MGQVQEHCPDCGFIWELLTRAEIAPRLVAAAERIAQLLQASTKPELRPEPTRWSSIEYAAHVRDVAYLVRDRMIRAVIEDVPTSPPLYREERVELGLYENDEVSILGQEVVNAASLIARTLNALSDIQLERTLHYGFPEPKIRTVLWTAAQVLHEFEHHGSDIAENERAD